MSQKVLYLGDETSATQLAQERLNQSGWVVDAVHSGPACVDAARWNAYDAVVIQTTEQIDAIDVLRELASQGEPHPTVLITRAGDEAIVAEAMKLGVDEYLVNDAEGGFAGILPPAVQRAVEQRRLLCEKRRIEQELNRVQQFEAIGQLAVGIAHEINNPAQYIGDNARFLRDAFADVSVALDALERLLLAARDGRIPDDLLQEVEAKLRDADIDYLTREIPQAIQQSLEGVEHVTNIIGAMKEFSHPANGRKQPVNLNHAIRGALTLCRNEWKYVAEMVVDLDPELPPVYCLATDINSAVVNLVVNAAQAVAESTRRGDAGKGTITVRTRYDHPWAEIRVEDNGGGIPEDVRNHVFDPFFTTKDVGEGSGQGLALVRSIVVEKHGGTIDFETKVGEGTAFILRLPINDQSETQAIAEKIIEEAIA